MQHEIFNILVSFLVFCGSVHMVYYTYKEPSSFISTNTKGYFGGGGMAIMSLMSIFGKFSLLDTIIQIVRKMLRFKKDESAIGVLVFIAIIFLILGLTYYRPDRILEKYKRISEENKDLKIKLTSGCFLFYFAFTIILIYLLVWLLKK